MKRALTGIAAAGVLLSAMGMAAGARVRGKDGRLTGGYMLGPSTSRGGSRQVFAGVAGRRKKHK